MRPTPSSLARFATAQQVATEQLLEWKKPSTVPQGSMEAIHESITRDLAIILGQKQQSGRWKLTSVQAAFDEQVAPKLRATRP